VSDYTQAKPQEEHEWLQKLVGEWAWESDNPRDQRTEAQHRGTETVRSLGGIWIVAEGRGQSPDGSPAESVMTLGYNPAKSAYVGTFVASQMNHMWFYEGWLDAEQNALILDTEGPSFEDMSKRTRYKDTIRIVDRDTRILTSSYQGEGGSWYELMAVRYRRR
jgi:hypothetical protein